MKNPKLVTPALLIVSVMLGLASCSDAKREQAAKDAEKQRIEAERQAQAEAAKANKAITTNNQKMFSRMNASSPGATPTQGSSPAQTPAPAEKK